MRLPSNFLARLKDVARRRSRGFSNNTSQIIGQWFLILVFALLSVVTVVTYAVYRFNYWSSIEERVAREEVGTAEYDEKTIEKILKEFKEKEEASENIMGVPLPKSSAPTDPDTSTQPAVSGDPSPALGE